MILFFQCEVLSEISKILLVFKFEMNWPHIQLITTFSAVWHYRDFKGSVIYAQSLCPFIGNKKLSLCMPNCYVSSLKLLVNLKMCLLEILRRLHLFHYLGNEIL